MMKIFTKKYFARQIQHINCGHEQFLINTNVTAQTIICIESSQETIYFLLLLNDSGLTCFEQPVMSTRCPQLPSDTVHSHEADKKVIHQHCMDIY